mgnify:FL=1
MTPISPDTSMQIWVNGKHVILTQATHQHVAEKLNRLGRYLDRSASADVVLQREKARCLAEGTITAKGTRLHASAETSEMHRAIDSMTVRIERQILKHKNKTSSHHRDKDTLKTHEEN